MGARPSRVVFYIYWDSLDSALSKSRDLSVIGRQLAGEKRCGCSKSAVASFPLPLRAQHTTRNIRYTLQTVGCSSTAAVIEWYGQPNLNSCTAVQT